MNKEVWRPVAGYEKLYLISNYGNVYSIRRQKMLKPRLVKGYVCVVLQDGKWKRFLVHRLVAQAFIPNPNILPQVNHKDENKLNNFVWVNEDGTVNLEKSNLEWCDQAYNNAFGTRVARGAENRKHPVLQYDKEGNLIKRHNSIIEAAESCGKSYMGIIACIKGRQKTCGGYKWKAAS